MTPIYKKIYEDLLKEIESGKYAPNTLLPSENELMNYYGISRQTVRKALNLLSQEGYIQKIHGKGSVVLDRSILDFPVPWLVSFKELSDKMNINTKTYVKSLKIEKPSSQIARHLQMAEDEEVWEVIRVRNIDHQNVILDKDYIKREIVPNLTIKICEESIFEYLENELNLEISYAKKVISAQDATEEDRELLDLKQYNVVIVVQSYIYLKDTTLLQYTESRHRPDKFKFTDFARRDFKQ